MGATVDLSRKRILVADDLPSARRILKSLLMRLGFQFIEEAPSGRVALERLQADPYDVVISDWEMPDMTGLDLLKAIRASDQFKTMPVIMVTSAATREAVVESMNAGVNSYILKPFNHESLMTALDKVFNPSAAKKD